MLIRSEMGYFHFSCSALSVTGSAPAERSRGTKRLQRTGNRTPTTMSNYNVSTYRLHTYALTHLSHFYKIECGSITVATPLLPTAAVVEDTGLWVAPGDTTAATNAAVTLAAAATAALGGMFSTAMKAGYRVGGGWSRDSVLTWKTSVF